MFGTICYIGYHKLFTQFSIIFTGVLDDIEDNDDSEDNDDIEDDLDESEGKLYQHVSCLVLEGRIPLPANNTIHSSMICVFFL